MRIDGIVVETPDSESGDTGFETWSGQFSALRFAQQPVEMGIFACSEVGQIQFKMNFIERILIIIQLKLVSREHGRLHLQWY